MSEQRSGDALRMYAARAIVYCPRDLAEALGRELGIPMSQGYFEQRRNDATRVLDDYAAWLNEAVRLRKALTAADFEIPFPLANMWQRRESPKASGVGAEGGSSFLPPDGVTASHAPVRGPEEAGTTTSGEAPAITGSREGDGPVRGGGTTPQTAPVSAPNACIECGFARGTGHGMLCSAPRETPTPSAVLMHLAAPGLGAGQNRCTTTGGNRTHFRADVTCEKCLAAGGWQGLGAAPSSSPAFPDPKQMATWLREYAQDAATFGEFAAGVLYEAADQLEHVWAAGQKGCK